MFFNRCNQAPIDLRAGQPAIANIRRGRVQIRDSVDRHAAQDPDSKEKNHESHSDFHADGQAQAGHDGTSNVIACDQYLFEILHSNETFTLETIFAGIATAPRARAPGTRPVCAQRPVIARTACSPGKRLAPEGEQPAKALSN
jgi:hypothetical protein